MVDMIRRRMVAAVTDDCTGCRACVDYCLVDCIDERPSGTAGSPAIQVHQDECIGCGICAKVCEQLALNGIRLVPIEHLASPTLPEHTLTVR